MCTVEDHRRRVTACKEQQSCHSTSSRVVLFVLYSCCDHLWSITHVKILQALTGLFAQQPCNNTVGMIEHSIMFQHIVYSLANRQRLFAYVGKWKTRLNTTKFMVLVTSLSNCVISSFPDNMFYHAWTCMTVDLSWWFQQRCSSLFVHQPRKNLFQYASTSLSTTMFKLASSTMFELVNMQKQAARKNLIYLLNNYCNNFTSSGRC